ncbi:PLP-dependent aminotransferase family protein [Eubacteriales bacterium KG127]
MAIEFGNRIKGMKGDAMSDLLQLTQQKDIISFAGGMPAPELFPIKELIQVSTQVLAEEGKAALQYSSAEGYIKLKEILADRMNKKTGTKSTANDLLITSGSQQGLDFMAKVFINPGDVILCESPSYLGAINAFAAYEPTFVEVPTDDEGMIISKLEAILSTAKNVKFIYVIPDFQNPTGRTWSASRRQEFMNVVNKYEIPVAEDNPYVELRYEGDPLPTFKSMDSKGLVVYLGTLSKILCPGYRIGWVYAAPEILKHFNTVKQAADLQSSSVAQWDITKYFALHDIDSHIEGLREVYAKRRDLMIEAMENFFPDGVTFTRPKGGLFSWVTLPKGLDAEYLYKEKALPKKVAFVPGSAFSPNGGHENSFRMNFSCMSEDKIVEGIRRLGLAIEEYIIEGK